MRAKKADEYQYSGINFEPLQIAPNTNLDDKVRSDQFPYWCFKLFHENEIGRDFLAELKKRSENILFPADPTKMQAYGGPLSFITFFEGQRTLLKTIEYGIQDYIVKPKDNKELN